MSKLSQIGDTVVKPDFRKGTGAWPVGVGVSLVAGFALIVGSMVMQHRAAVPRVTDKYVVHSVEKNSADGVLLGVEEVRTATDVGITVPVQTEGAHNFYVASDPHYWLTLSNGSSTWNRLVDATTFKAVAVGKTYDAP